MNLIFFLALLTIAGVPIDVLAFVVPNQKQQLPQRHHHKRSEPITNANPGNTYDNENQSLFSQRPKEVFAQISSRRSTIGFDDLLKWEELDELLEDGDILLSELKTLYNQTCTINNDEEPQLHDEMSFVAFYNTIVDLFDYDDDNSNDDVPFVTKEEEFITFLTNGMNNSNRVDDYPCGIDATDKERDTILKFVTEIVDDTGSNRIATIQAKDLLGSWNLLYTSSKAMIRNKSLSGLTVIDGGTKLNGIQQILTGSKFLGFVEFVESYASSASTQDYNSEEVDGEQKELSSFNVKITGEWMLKEQTRTINKCSLQIDPDNIDYDVLNASGMEASPVVQVGGGVSQVADWQSLGPIKLLDIIYSSSDLYISRGQFDSTVLFVWRKVN